MLRNTAVNGGESAAFIELKTKNEELMAENKVKSEVYEKFFTEMSNMLASHEEYQIEMEKINKNKKQNNGKLGDLMSVGKPISLHGSTRQKGNKTKISQVANFVHNKSLASSAIFKHK